MTQSKGVFISKQATGSIASIQPGSQVTGKWFSTGISLTLYSSVVDLFRGIIGLQKKEKLKFGVSGRLHLEGGFLLPSTFPFNAEEELALEGFDKRK